jgi:hypothetical protein
MIAAVKCTAPGRHIYLFNDMQALAKHSTAPAG